MAGAETNWSQNFGVVKTLGAALILVAAALFVFDLAVAGLVSERRVGADVIDIQTPAALIAKTGALANFKGRKIVLLGDSLVAGQIMAEHGDKDWRDHTLSALLQRHYDGAAGTQALVLNLGMNGTLPADLETLAGALIKLNPDAIIMDISLRAFSRDFAKPADMYSRTWLKPGLTLNARGLPVTINGQAPAETWLERTMLKFWRAYRLRDFIRARWFGGEPRDAVWRLRHALDAKGAAQPVAGDAGEMRLLMQVRSRYASSDLEAANPQVAALVRLLHKLRDAKIKTVVFYATEAPRLLPSLLEPEKFAPLVTKLKETVVHNGGASVKYLPANSALTDSMFLDHVHVDAKGNGIYAAAILGALGD